MSITIQSYTHNEFRETRHFQTLEECHDISFFQSTQYPLLFENIPGNEFHWILAFNASDEIQASMLVHISSSTALLKHLTTKATIWHGPYWFSHPSPEVLDKMLNRMQHLIPSHTLFIQFRNQEFIPLLLQTFNKYSYRFNPRYNQLTSTTDLNLSRAALSPSRRREIRQSINNGLQILSDPDNEQITEFYHILTQLYKYKIHKPLPPLNLFLNANQLRKEKKINIVIHLCVYQSKVVGGIVAPYTKNNTLFEFYICGLDAELRHKKIFPSVMATWSAMEAGNNLSCRQFDFMGMGLPDKKYGVRDFKKRFGGTLINPGRYNRIHHPLLYTLAEILYNLHFVFIRIKARFKQ